MLEVDRGEDDEDGDEERRDETFAGETEAGEARGDEKRREQLHERIAQADTASAVPAAAAQHEVGDDRDVVVPADLAAARDAARPAADDRLVSRQPRRHDGEKAPEREGGWEGDGCEQGVQRRRLAVDLRPARLCDEQLLAGRPRRNEVDEGEAVPAVWPTKR